MSETSNSIINIPDLPNSINNAVQNLTDKPSLSIGTTFSDLWDLIFGGISYLSEKKKIKYAHNLEAFRKQLGASIEQIPPEKTIEPSIQTTAQALENSKYCIDQENLREMFTALISNSLNSDFQNDIHPSFAEILKQMSPLDAEIIKVFKRSEEFALAQYQITDSEGYIVILEHAFLEYPKADLESCSLSISSLSRLGLLYTTYSFHISNDKEYDPFRKHSWIKMVQKKNIQMKLLKLLKGVFH